MTEVFRIVTRRAACGIPRLLAGEREARVLARADVVLEEVGMRHRRGARPHTLSGGEMQRAAIARALIHNPALFLANEPIGNLDSRSAEQVLHFLVRMGRRTAPR